MGSAFESDDGRADPTLRLALSSGESSLTRLISTARLLVAVVAVADDIDAESGADKDSHMAVVSMVNTAGERGLLAFSGIDSMHLWNREARPVPVMGSAAAQAALDDGNTALVVDVAGPHRWVAMGEVLSEIAEYGETSQ